MENASQNEDPQLNKQIYTELFNRSIELKKKNNILTEKLNSLKKRADEFLKKGFSSKNQNSG